MPGEIESQGIKLTQKGIRVPPQDIEAEKALLGSIMLKPDLMIECADLVLPHMFYVSKHGNIYQVMMDLSQGGDPIDLVSVTSRLKEKKLLDKIGGASFLSDLVNSVPTASNAMYYADVVAKKYTLRNLIHTADHISETAFDESAEVDDILDMAGKKILDIASYSKNKFISIKDTLSGAWERLDRLHNSEEEMRGVPTGFNDLDHKLAGLQKADLIILAARPSVGKTSLALDIARNTALKHGTTVGFFSLEMGAGQLADRMLAAEAMVDAWKLRVGRLSDEELEVVGEAMGRLNEAPIYIDDDSYTDIMRMRSVARKLKAEKDLGLIVVDYLQLMVPRRHSDSLVQQVTEISRSLKALARELDVPVLALSQLNRNVEQRGGTPKLADLRDSGSIEQDADVVMFIHRDEDKDKGGKQNMTQILIEKHRNGATGRVELYFDDKKTSFSNIEKSSFGDF